MIDSSNMSDSDEPTTASSSNSIAFDDHEIDSDLPDAKWQLQALESKYRNLIKLIVSGKSKISTVKSPKSQQVEEQQHQQQFRLDDASTSQQMDDSQHSLSDKRHVVTSLSDDELKIKLLDKLCRVQVKLNDLIEREAFSIDDNQRRDSSSTNSGGGKNLIASCHGHKFVNSCQFNSIGYLATLSPYIKAVISNKIFAIPSYLLLTATGYVENFPAIMPNVGQRPQQTHPTDITDDRSSDGAECNLDPFNFSASTNGSGSSSLLGASSICDCCGKRINRFGYSTLSNITSAVMRPLASSLNSSNFPLSSNSSSQGLLTCEYCFYQIHEDCFEYAIGAMVSHSNTAGTTTTKSQTRNRQGSAKSQATLNRIRPCPKILFDQYDLPNYQFISADQVLNSQNRLKSLDVDEYAANKPVDTSGLSGDLGYLDPEADQSSHDQSLLTETLRASDLVSPSIDCCPSSIRRAGSSASLSSKSNMAHQEQEAATLTPLLPIGQYTGDLLIMKICPEAGLHSQDFACADCDMPISLSTSRLCHYDGKYYCFKCHTGDEMTPIPARIVKNWDFTAKPVSRTSWHKICFIRTRPILFNLFEMNSMLYGFIDKLVDIKQVRESLKSMINYLRLCGQPHKPKLFSVPAHFLNDDLINYYSLNDLLNIQQVYDSLCLLQSTLEHHIVKVCESCRGKGFFCELCKDEEDVLFPFSANAVSCLKCSAVYHKNCYNRKKKNCPKCVRLNKKKQQQQQLQPQNSQ